MIKYSIGLGFTSNCNMNCPFCYSKNKRKDSRDLSIDDWISFVHTNHVYIKNINYGTGENTTSEDWYSFVLYVREKYPEIRQALTTNGSLAYITRNDIRKKKILTECIDEIDVSLDFGEQNLHNYYRGNPNAYSWALETLEYCNKYGKDPTIVMLGIDDTLTENNLSKIFEIAKVYNAKVRINLYRPVDLKSKIKPVSFEKIECLFHWINRNQIFLSVSDPLFSSLHFENYVKRDPSGISSVRIIQNGDIFPSTYLLSPELKMGNIKDFEFSKINNNIIRNMIKQISLPLFCEDCPIHDSCGGGVLDRRYLWYGSFEECDPYCPAKNGISKANIQSMDRYLISDKSFNSVHDGYLPTLFFGFK